MMSESDDTDVLLLIPPDLFLVPSSDSEDSEFGRQQLGYGLGVGATGVVTELFEQVQSLENRISLIESKDTSLDASFLNCSSEAQLKAGSYSSPSKQNKLSLRNKSGSVSQISSLQNTPTKLRQVSSVPTTPSSHHHHLHHHSTNYTNHFCCDMTSVQFDAMNSSNATNALESHSTNLIPRNKHNNLTSFSEPSIIQHSSSSDVKTTGIPHSFVPSQHRETHTATSPKSNASLKPIGKRLHQRSVKEMELSEVDELLHEMEATEAELAKRISNRSSYQLRQGDVCHPNSISENDVRFKEVNWDQGFNSASPACRLDSNSQCTKLSDPHQNLPTAVTNICMAFDEDSLHLDATDKMIADFKTWRYNCCPTVPQKVEQANNNHKDSMAMSEDLEKQTYARSNSLSNANIDVNKKIIGSDQPTIAVNSDNAHLHASNDRTNSNTAASNLHSDTSKAYTPVHSTHVESGQRQFAQSHRNSYSTGNLLNCTNEDIRVFQNVDATHKMGNDAATNTEFSRKSHRLLTLSDFWESDPSKSQEDMLRIKLEEEKFRRDHCEHLIQELQKRLLEQQEKVAVAVRVDNEKNVVITRLQNAWTKLKLRWQVLEAESSDLHLTLKNVKDKHRTECTELQSQIKRYEGELSKALDLAGGYKEKSDTLTKEKLDLLKSHADELENYKSLVQEVENRYSQLKDEYNKVLDHNQQLGVALKNTQQEVNKERLRGGEVREEMGVIHKALDACEAELIVLRQEKENLQLKLKEETNRNHILEQNKSILLTAIDEAKMAEKAANAEAKSIAAQQERIRIELREVYQKQVDEVVKAKLQEFQSQLDAAESAFHSELESRQRAIAECAARKIKTVLDKHQLEINLLEEKHKEEKRLYEIQLAQAMQQVSMLNTKLNSQHANKTQLAEQLHSVMQRQWQQALQIISGGNMDNLTPIQRIHAEKFFENKHPMKSESSPNIGSSIMEPMRLESHSMPVIDGRGFLSARLTEERDGHAKSNTLTDNTPLTSRRDQPKDDLRRYIKMILDMQQPKSNFVQAPCSESRQSPTPICREVPRKHYTKKEQSFLSEDSSVVWQPSSEIFTQEESEYVSVPEKPAAKGDQQKNKPPWK
ncbi:cytadherence high molecular weight protein 2-like isoform X2 [Neodiprion fabricii]|uniref:cytadherence high molecular weight protein 2-like isoform X2 n=1 Tax=Neodiprion fabricii TaxID=2872261 RepID=UPI001ED8FD18|nr:cytadherence high molecular weight protein 2-like isoform X2 [Neodiprion fabricii]